MTAIESFQAQVSTELVSKTLLEHSVTANYNFIGYGKLFTLGHNLGIKTHKKYCWTWLPKLFSSEWMDLNKYQNKPHNTGDQLGDRPAVQTPHHRSRLESLSQWLGSGIGAGSKHTATKHFELIQSITLWNSNYSISISSTISTLNH